MLITGVEGPNAGRILLAICRLAGDTLRVGYDLSVQARRLAFASDAGSQHVLVTYERATT